MFLYAPAPLQPSIYIDFCNKSKSDQQLFIAVIYRKWLSIGNGRTFFLQESDLQKQIEQAYQDMIGQRKTKTMYQFLTSENVYNVFFDSTREMYQVNVRTGTKRQMKRRPEKPISYDDLNKWYGYFIDSSICRFRQPRKSTVNAMFYLRYKQELCLTSYKLFLIRDLIRI